MQNFFLGIIEITLGMTILILLMLILLKLIGRKFTAKCRYILWTLVMIRLAIPLSFGILPALIEVPVEPEPEPVQIQIPVVSYTPIPQEPAAVPQQEHLQIPSPPVETPMFTEPEPDPLTWEEISAYIPHLYLTGAAVFLLWNLLAYMIYTRRILRSAKPADTGSREIYTAVCCKKGIHHPPVLLVSTVVNSPAAFGLIRRRIVLPDIEFTENALVGTLSHEVTHCKRGDLWIKTVCLLARSFHWFNPLIHLAAFRCEMEMELSCDESVLAGCSEDTRAVYGEIMLDIIRRCRNNRGTLTTHFNPKKNAVKLRLQNILYGSGKKRGLWLIAVCLVLCLVAGAIVACRTEKDDVQETLTEPLPDGETVEIPLIYKQYTPELSQDMFVEEIQETELTEILQDQELCGVRVILYLDENELFCAAYERDDTLFRFIRTGGVEPVSYDAEEFSDILEADGFTVSWSWSHHFRTYFTVEDGAPALYLDAYDNVTESDYDNDGVTEVICQNMTNVDIYDISDGTLQTVSFDSELIRPKPGEFYRYLPEKNWFEFDYKKGREDTLFHRYGTVQDGMLTLVTPDETIDTSETGEFPTMEAYVTNRIAKETTAQYFAAEPDGSFSNKQKTANVTDTKLLRLEKKGELADLAPEGTLECWEYKYLIKLDVPTEEVMTVGGQQEEDGWFDLEGQNGHTVVALRYPDGTYTILMDEMTGDSLDFTGYRNSYEEAIYDWYVTEYDLDLPLYVEEWGNLITPPEGERIGNTPVHRFDGDGWGIYIPIQAWYSSTDALENQWLWRSSYNTGSMMTVDVCSHTLEDEYVTAELQGYTPTDRTNRIWELHIDDIHSYYYYYENPDGGFWRVTIGWTEEAITDYPYIAIEPQVLKRMAESFVVIETGRIAEPSGADAIWQNFLDTVVAPYENYIASKEFLDLDGNGIDELLLYDLGNGICEIYTLEGGEVKCLSAGISTTGASLLTIYSDNPTALAPPSLGAGEYVFYASCTPEYVTKTRYKNWFVPSPKTGGYVLYSMYGHTTSRTDQYFHFYSGEDTILGKVLCVEELSRFELEAIDSNSALGWECWHQSEKVTKSQYIARLEECWNDLEQTYGVTYTVEETNHHLDELRKAPDTSFELLADLLDTLKMEDPQVYMSRRSYGESESAERYAAWGFYNHHVFAKSLSTEYTFEPLTAMEVQETTQITLHSPSEGEWTIHSWVNSNYVELITGGQSYFFRAVYKYNSEQYFGDALKNWFDHAEYAATPYQAVIPDTGQGFLAAAQTFVDSWYNRNLQVSSGSRYAYSYVSCSVRDAENREYLIENGFIGENTYTYYITVIFVPENPHAGMESMAGNTELYTGNDSAILSNAFEFYRVGYITLEEDGWHGEVGGTGW